MKLNLFPRMKSIGIFATAAMLALTSCKKDNSGQNAQNTVTEEEAVEVIAQGIAESSGGFVSSTEGSAKVANATQLSCGASSDTIISSGSMSGALVNFTYGFEITRSMTCKNGIPFSYSLNYKGQNSYEAPRMISNDHTTASVRITGIEPSSAQLSIGQDYVRVGTQQSKVRLQRSFSSTLTINSSAIVISKSSRQITSGTASVSFEGEVAGGKRVSYSGAITFHGNRAATLVLKSGTTVELNW